MVKIYKQPFAHEGDTIAIPSASQPDGKMSNIDGWTPDYQLPKTDPNYKPVGRQEMNGVFKAVTESLGQMQVQGSASWSPAGAPYPINAQVYHNGKQWIALRANSVPPAEGEDWSEWGDSLRQDLANPDKGAAMVARSTVTVRSIENLLTISPTAGMIYRVIGYHEGSREGGGDFVWDGASELAPDSGTVFMKPGEATGRFLRVIDGDWWVEWFGVRKNGVDDDSPAIRAAVAGVPDGGNLNFGTGDFLMGTPVRIAKLLNLFGSGMGTRMLVVDRGFILGLSSTDPLVRFNAQPIIENFFFTSAPGGIRGNVAAYFGSSAPGHGYQTRTTTFAGFKKSETENATNTAIVYEQIYAPCKISGCYFFEIGTGIKVGLNYGHIIENNRFLWCTVGVDIAGISTTVNVKDNTIERSAIGVYIHWPCHHILLDHNVIEANYGGCDILCWQGPQSLTIRRNYMEASPECIVFAGGTESYPASKVIIEENFSVRLSIKGTANNFLVARNNLSHVDLSLLVGSTLSNIVFEDNYLRSDETPFSTEYVETGGTNVFTGVKWNSVSNKIREQVKFISATRFIGPAAISHETDYLNSFIRSHTGLVRNASASIAKAFEVSIPNENCIAFIEVSSIKSRNTGGTESVRRVKHTVAIRRIKDQDATSAVTLDSDVDVPSIGTPTIFPANTDPTTSIAGSSTESQTVAVNILNGVSGGTGNWVMGITLICNRTDISISRGA